ncbi:hypothetical protein EIP91_008196 [Steccherinum ochraceum]|uniref:Galactose oxidase-like Early set domain-containing protein n=1 Tax=Steccherinum ochraceum TaxID=92696 RepID=A0A4R0RL53_9APHY|nr:hypothetical protein EIP91_008196 [Steccherinum ochraceum]
MRSIGCAIYVLTLAGSLCQAVFASPAPSYSNTSDNLLAREDASAPDPLGVLFGTAGGLSPRDDFTSTNASDGTLEARDVYSPRILDPRSTSVWVAGQSALVRWDTSDPPSSITNRNGKLVLGYMDEHTANEHLFLDQPLATNFDIMKGFQKVRVPQVPPGNNYIVVLFGDSGNRSPEFTIN